MALETFSLRIQELNGYLKYLPPPLNDKLTDDKIFDIIQNAVPAWNKKFEEAHLKTQITTIEELVQYYNKLENGEQKQYHQHTKYNNNNNRSPVTPDCQQKHYHQQRNNNSINNTNFIQNKQNPRQYCHQHNTYNHSWYDCSLNPRSVNYNPNKSLNQNFTNRNQNNNQHTKFNNNKNH
jgi:hypothetical protein